MIVRRALACCSALGLGCTNTTRLLHRTDKHVYARRSCLAQAWRHHTLVEWQHCICSTGLAHHLRRSRWQSCAQQQVNTGYTCLFKGIALTSCGQRSTKQHHFTGGSLICCCFASCVQLCSSSPPPHSACSTACQTGCVQLGLSQLRLHPPPSLQLRHLRPPLLQSQQRPHPRQRLHLPSHLSQQSQHGAATVVGALSARSAALICDQQLLAGVYKQ
jgi:hypothetical protein